MCRKFYHDDAYITLRYAFNFLNGHGLLWNPGEAPVEGYSNFLFLLLISALGYLGIDLQLASQLLNVLAYAGILAVLFVYARHYERSQQRVTTAFILCSLLFVSDWNLIIWSFGGLEAVFLALLILSAVVLFVRYLESDSISLLVTSSVMFCLAGMTRLDSGLFIALSGFVLVIRSVAEKKYSHVLYFALPGLIFIPFFVGRYWYYGDLFPNTFYAKAGNYSFYRLFTGSIYNLLYLLMPPFLLSLVFLLAFRQRKQVKNDSRLRYLLLLAVTQFCYVLYSGGDHMPAFRFYVSIEPVLLITLYHLLSYETGQWTLRRSKAVVSALACYLVLQVAFHLFVPIKADNAAFFGKIIGEYINKNFPEGSLVALNTAGSTPYYAPDMNFIDMLGLNDYHIARQHTEINFELVFQNRPGHAKGDGQYVLGREPDYIILGPALGLNADDKQWFISGYEIIQQEAFSQHYEAVTVNIDVSSVDGIDMYPHKRIKDGYLTFVYFKRIQAGESDSKPYN